MKQIQRRSLKPKFQPRPTDVVDSRMLPLDGDPPQQAIVFTGESHETALEDQHRHVGVVSLTEFRIQLDAYRTKCTTKIADPQAIEHAVAGSETANLVLLSHGTLLNTQHVSFLDDWRHHFQDELLRAKRGPDTLAGILESLLCNNNGIIKYGTCPGIRDNCAYKKIHKAKEFEGRRPPSCDKCHRQFLLADALRVHRELESEFSNELVFTRIRQALIHVIFRHYIRATHKPQARQRRKDTAFVLLGPHAIFGSTASGLKTRLARKFVKETRTQDIPLMVGLIQKGPLAEYAMRVNLPRKHVLELSRQYIKENIISGAPDDWGDETYYGQPFIYRTKKGHCVAFTLPKRHVKIENYRAKAYAEIHRACLFLDDVIDDNEPTQTLLPTLIHSRGTIDATSARPILQELSTP